MDFRFNVNNLLPKRINKITHTLIPEGFRGDRREYNEYQRLLTRILDDMGEASAKAQGLNKTITNAVKIRDTDHIIYLMVDKDGNNGLGSVIGLLKTGSKTLFMFDENGLHYQVKPRCILDFYIHESRQRSGLGIELYQHMLAEENIKPIKLAIDRPSGKFLAFLEKHFGLTSFIPQNNKFVVFTGFFDDEIHDSSSSTNRYSSSSPNLQSSEHKNKSNNMDHHPLKNTSTNGTPVTRSPYGRYAASRPPCSMASIIHDTADQSAEHTRPVSARSSRGQSRERPDSLELFIKQEVEENLQSDSNDEALLEKQTEDLQNVSLEESETVNFQVEAINLPMVTRALEAESRKNSEANDVNLKEEIDGNGTRISSPTPGEEISGNDHSLTGGHLDLKFYHSPLW